MGPRPALFSLPHRRSAAPPGIARLEAKYAAQISTIMNNASLHREFKSTARALNVSFKLKVHSVFFASELHSLQNLVYYT